MSNHKNSRGRTHTQRKVTSTDLYHDLPPPIHTTPPVQKEASDSHLGTKRLCPSPNPSYIAMNKINWPISKCPPANAYQPLSERQEHANETINKLNQNLIKIFKSSYTPIKNEIATTTPPPH